MAKVGIIMGSRSDLGKMKAAAEVLQEFSVTYEMTIASAHRTPERVRDWVAEMQQGGVEVFIAGAGMSAHLAGVVASLTRRPVIGVPCSGGALGGVDALYSTVNMPKGTPVATVAVDGAYNGGLLAIQILALGDATLQEKLKEHKQKMADGVARQAQELEDENSGVE